VSLTPAILEKLRRTVSFGVFTLEDRLHLEPEEGVVDCLLVVGYASAPSSPPLVGWSKMTGAARTLTTAG
jgi:hypothetical protein